MDILKIIGIGFCSLIVSVILKEYKNTPRGGYFYGENGLTIVKAIFFPETGNLYNLVKTFDNFPESSFSSPRVVWRYEEIYG